MSLTKRLSEYVRACFTGLWIKSFEPDEALTEIAQLCRQEEWQLATWDIDRGFLMTGSDGVADTSANDPLAALRAVSALGSPDHTLLVVLKNLHRFLNSAEIIQTLAHRVAAGKQRRVFFVVLAPIVQLPVELEKLFVVLEHELPNRDQLLEIAQGIATEAGELPQELERERVLDAAGGLTRYEAEGAFSLALVRHERIEASTIWELKSQTILKSGLLSLYRGSEAFAELGGLESLKAFCLRALRSRGADNHVRPRGILALGVAGTGKSAFCKALGNETGRPTLVLDVGSLMGSLVGQTEERTRQALRIVDAMQPAVLMIDEVEKALSGIAGSSQSDSGVSARLFGSLLSWLNDHDSDVFVVCTANDVTKLPPEFSRAERFDGIFFLDLPGSAQKEAIWRQYIGVFGLDTSQRLPEDTQWTGAEIKSCCRLAALLDVSLMQAAQNVVPIAVTNCEAVERLRNWASGRCLSAEESGLYRPPAQARRTRSRPTGDADHRLN